MGPGEYFAPHFDGRYRRPDGSEESFITIQLYLNEGFEGGNTTFISSSSEADNVGVVPRYIMILFHCKIFTPVPRIGRVLVFQHDILHEGSLLLGARNKIYHENRCHVQKTQYNLKKNQSELNHKNFS